MDLKGELRASAATVGWGRRLRKNQGFVPVPGVHAARLFDLLWGRDAVEEAPSLASPGLCRLGAKKGLSLCPLCLPHSRLAGDCSLGASSLPSRGY